MSTTALLFILCLSIIINPTSSQEDVYDASLDFYCGKEWADAANSCTHNCQSGKDSDCINLLGIGYECFKFTGCKEKIDNNGKVIDKVQEVIDKVEDTIVNAGTSNYCGDSWADAMLTCGRPCASGGNNECLGDGTCFAATNCQGELQSLVADMLVTLLGSDMQEMQGEDSNVLKYTLSKTLRGIVEDQGVALDDVDLGEQSLITRRELEERYHQRSLMGWHEDGLHMKVNNITHRMLPTGSSALDVSMTISGNYRPPPYINFGKIVEDSINRQGQKVVSTLRERGSQVGRSYFERVEGIEAQQKSNVTPRPSRKPSQRPTLSPTTFQSMIPSISPSEGIKAEPSSAPSLDHYQEVVTGSQEDLELGGTTTSSYGYIFNIRTKESSGVVMINGFDFYTESTEDVNFELWTRLGSYSDYKGTYDGWDLIASGTTQGRGLGRYTSIPQETFTPVSIPGGGGDKGTRAFYITTDTRDLVYKIGEGTSSDELVQQESEDIKIYEGEGVLFYPFPSAEEAFFYRGPRQYLGTIAYNRLPCSPYSLYGQVLELDDDGGCPKVPTIAPTISNAPTVVPPSSSPTLEITTMSPVGSNSPISSQQESKVTETPTVMNEGNPTLTPTNPKPSASPSTSAPTPSPIVSMKVNIRTLIRNVPARDMTEQEAAKLLETLETFLIHNTQETLVIVGLDLWHHKMMVSEESISKSSRGNTRALKLKQEEAISVPFIEITYIVRISVASLPFELLGNLITATIDEYEEELLTLLNEQAIFYTYFKEMDKIESSVVMGQLTNPPTRQPTIEGQEELVLSTADNEEVTQESYNIVVTVGACVGLLWIILSVISVSYLLKRRAEMKDQHNMEHLLSQDKNGRQMDTAGVVSMEEGQIEDQSNTSDVIDEENQKPSEGAVVVKEKEIDNIDQRKKRRSTISRLPSKIEASERRRKSRKPIQSLRSSLTRRPNTLNNKKKHYRSRAVVSSLKSSLKRRNKNTDSSPAGGKATKSRKRIPSSVRRRLSIEQAIPSNIRRRLSIDLDQARFRLSVDTNAAVVLKKPKQQSKGLKQKESIV